MSSMSNFLQSSNPVLNDDTAFREAYGQMRGESAAAPTVKPTTASLQGVVNKTALLLAIAVGGGLLGYKLVSAMPSIMWISSIAAFVITLGFFFILKGKPQLAMYVGPVFAIVEGVFLGSLTSMLDQMLVSKDIVPVGGLGLQAFIITISIMLAMLALYSARIIKPTKKFVAVISTLMLGMMMTYALSFVLGFFGIQLPFVSLNSALQGGGAAWIGLGINALFLGVAALFLIIDFAAVEQIIETGQPKHMEWYAGFVLLVSLAWVYMETVKMLFRLYLLFGSRD